MVIAKPPFVVLSEGKDLLAMPIEPAGATFAKRRDDCSEFGRPS
jgi:hypothetical protein